MYVKRTSQSGMTLVEMLLALGIFSFVALAAFSFIFPYFFMTQRLRESMTDVVDNDLGVRMIMRELENSYIIRSDGLSCGEMDTFLKTSLPFKSGPSLTLSPGKMISFPYSVFAGMAARDVNSTNGMFVTDSVQYPKDSIVMAIHPDDSTHFGFFKVDAVNPARSQITLTDAGLSTTPTLCSSSGTPSTLSQLFAFNGGGSKGLILHRIRIVSYLRGNTTSTNDKVYRSSWPDEQGAASQPKSLFFNGLIDATFKSGWENYKDVSDSSVQRSGKWTAEMNYKVYQKSMVNQKSSPDHKGERIYDIVSRASYDLAATRRLNTAVETGASTAEVKFPTCSVMISDSPKEIDYSATDLTNVKAYSVTGTVSDDVAGVIQAQLLQSGPLPARASCHLEDDLIPDYRITEVSSNSVVLVKAASGFSKYICLVSGSMNLNASMSYVDPKTQRTFSGIPCSGGSVTSPNAFKFIDDNNVARCFKDGQIDLGSELRDAATLKVPGPKLYLRTNNPCVWSDGTQGTCNIADHYPNALDYVYIEPRTTEITNLPGGKLDPIPCSN